jgi:hypothetical protein
VKINFLISIIILSFLFCCNRNNVIENNVTLFLDTKDSQFSDEHFLIDSIRIEHNDSLRIIFYTGSYQDTRTYHKKANGLYEIRPRFNEIPEENFGTDTILTFSKSDTIFLFHSEFDFIPFVFYYGFANCEYKILKENGIYKSTKKSLIDTTYKEIFFYDKDYNICKYINTWKDNESVYIKKE